MFFTHPNIVLNTGTAWIIFFDSKAGQNQARYEIENVIAAHSIDRFGEITGNLDLYLGPFEHVRDLY